MFATIDAFVMWFAKQPIALFLVGFVGAKVFMCIGDTLKSPGVYDYPEDEDTDDN